LLKINEDLKKCRCI